MKKTHLLSIGLALVIAVALLGPRVNMDISLDKVILPNNLDLYLSESESRFDDITQGTEKVIMWAGTPGEKNRYFNCFFSWFFCHPAGVVTLG
ncbi:hypothetical protein OAD80_01755 [Porticoccaceae bacterium]|nr:hypothetical protein [Porticoccaceae bacterium]